MNLVRKIDNYFDRRARSKLRKWARQDRAKFSGRVREVKENLRYFDDMPQDLAPHYVKWKYERQEVAQVPSRLIRKLPALMLQSKGFSLGLTGLGISTIGAATNNEYLLYGGAVGGALFLLSSLCLRKDWNELPHYGDVEREAKAKRREMRLESMR